MRSIPMLPTQRAWPSAARTAAATIATALVLLAAGADDQFPPAEVQLLLPGMREFSQCMRSHGVPDWPDPTVDSQGRPGFNIAIPGDHGFAPGRGLPASPPVARGGQINTKINECERLEP